MKNGNKSKMLKNNNQNASTERIATVKGYLGELYNY